MENRTKIEVALVRGNSLNEWEGRLWEGLPPEFSVTGYCSRRNLYSTGLSFPVKRLRSSVDSFLSRQSDKFLYGRFQPMKGLEAELSNFDIAHVAEVSYFFTTQAVRAKKKNNKLRVVATVWDNSFGRFEYNYWPEAKNPPAWWRKKINGIIKENIKGIDLFLPITEYSAEMLRDYGAPAEKIKILTPAVIMPDSEVSAEKILEQHSLSGKQIYLMVNRMVKEKGVYDALYAWRIYLCKKGSGNKVLVVIGNGPERENIMRLAHEWGIDDQVRFVTQLPNEQVRTLYKHAKTLLLASLPGPLWQEQFGFVLAEAICNDCPVVSVYSGAIPEVIEDAGILAVPGNPPDIARALERLDDELIYQSLKANCRRVKTKFEADNFRKQLIINYKSLLNE